MPHKWSTFISYRHTENYKGKEYVQRLVEELQAELEFSVQAGVYIDHERMNGAQFYKEHLAINLCHSVCMVALYWPTYFSNEHTFCAREFYAMEKLEEARLKLLTDDEERTNSLILVVALRGFKQIPKPIRERRLCWNFEPYMCGTDLRANQAFQDDIRRLAGYIADRVTVFGQLNSDPFGSCGGYRLPDASTIRSWIEERTRPPLFPR